jgi:GAF domain-containing protein
LKLCDAAESTIVLVEGDALRFAAGFGTTSTLQEGETIPLSRGSVTGRAVVDRTLIHMADLEKAPAEDFPIALELQRRIGHHAILSVPLMREDRAIGAIALWRMEARPFTEKQIALVETFANQAAIAIENVRLFNATKEALEQQTAISEILRVISSSPTDVQPVLDAIAERAAQLCDASAASMYLTDGETLRHLASKGPSPDAVSHVDSLPISRGSISGRALLERRTIEVDDMLAEGTEYPLSLEIAQRAGHRTVVVVPLFREGKPFGTILLRRQEVRPFSERELACGCSARSRTRADSSRSRTSTNPSFLPTCRTSSGRRSTQSSAFRKCCWKRCSARSTPSSRTT